MSLKLLQTALDKRTSKNNELFQEVAFHREKSMTAEQELLALRKKSKLRETKLEGDKAQMKVECERILHSYLIKFEEMQKASAALEKQILEINGSKLGKLQHSSHLRRLFSQTQTMDCSGADEPPTKENSHCSVPRRSSSRSGLSGRSGRSGRSGLSGLSGLRSRSGRRSGSIRKRAKPQLPISQSHKVLLPSQSDKFIQLPSRKPP